MIKPPSFVNPYMELVGSAPFILGADGALSDSQKEEFLTLLRSHEKCVVEIGCGSGLHLSSLAAASPTALHIGFELRFKRAYSAARKAEKCGLSNVRILRLDGRALFDIFPDSSLDGVYVNFPDPWDRRRWEKHRILKADVIKRILPLLKPDGFIHYRTDHKEAFERGVQALTAEGRLRCVLLEKDRIGDPPPNLCRSEFGNLFKSKGIPVSYVTVQNSLTL